MADSKSRLVLILVGAIASAATFAEEVPSSAERALAARSEEGVDSLAPRDDQAWEDRGGDPPPGCEPGAGDCYIPNGSPGCEDIDCCTEVCLLDTFCCLFDWDVACVELAWEVCDPPTGIGARPEESVSVPPGLRLRPARTFIVAIDGSAPCSMSSSMAATSVA